MTDKIREAFNQWLSTADDADFVTLEAAWTSGYQACAIASQERITELEQAIEQWKAGREAQAELIAKYAAELEAAKKDAMRKGYLLGFNASCDGYNGQDPYGEDLESPENDGAWRIYRDAAIDAAMSEAK